MLADAIDSPAIKTGLKLFACISNLGHPFVKLTTLAISTYSLYLSCGTQSSMWQSEVSHVVQKTKKAVYLLKTVRSNASPPTLR